MTAANFVRTSYLLTLVASPAPEATVVRIAAIATVATNQLFVLATAAVFAGATWCALAAMGAKATYRQVIVALWLPLLVLAAGAVFAVVAIAAYPPISPDELANLPIESILDKVERSEIFRLVAFAETVALLMAGTVAVVSTRRETGCGWLDAATGVAGGAAGASLLTLLIRFLGADLG
jgi:hypothetical protein